MGGSLNNSRISFQKTSCEPSKGGKGCGTGQPGQKDSRRLPFPSLGSKQFRSALEKKYPGLKISCSKLFSNRCQTHSIQICHVPGSSPYLGDPINSTQCQRDIYVYIYIKYLIWAYYIHQRGVGTKECASTILWFPQHHQDLWLRVTLTSFPKPLPSGCLKVMISFTLWSQKHMKNNSNWLTAIIACIYLGGSEWAWHFAPQQSPTKPSTATSQDNAVAIIACEYWGLTVHTGTAYISWRQLKTEDSQKQTASFSWIKNPAEWDITKCADNSCIWMLLMLFRNTHWSIDILSNYSPF